MVFWFRNFFCLFLKKTTALFLSLSLILSQNLSYGSENFIPPSVPLLPADLGRVEFSSRGSSNKTIFYIQDAHDSLEAQENIARMISYWVRHAGVQTIFEEGYEGEVPTDHYFDSIRDPKVKEKISFFLLDRLRLGAAEYAHINRSQDFKLIGADSIQGQRAAIEQYRKAAARQKSIQRDLEPLQAQLNFLIQKRFPKEVKEWMKLKERFDDGTLSLPDYLQRIFERVPQKSRGKFPLLSGLLSGSKSGVNFSAAELFSEKDQLEKMITEKGLAQAEDKTLFYYWQSAGFLRRLSELRVSPQEYKAAKKYLEQWNTQDAAQFLSRELKRPVVLSKRWEQEIREAVLFYQKAHDRETAIRAQLVRFAADPGEKTAVLVFGGFHKEGILDILREQGFSFHVVSPKIQAPDTEHGQFYKTLMTEGRYSFEMPAAMLKGARPEGALLRWRDDAELSQAELAAMTREAAHLPSNADRFQVRKAMEKALLDIHAKMPELPMRAENRLVESGLSNGEAAILRELAHKIMEAAVERLQRMLIREKPQFEAVMKKDPFTGYKSWLTNIDQGVQQTVLELIQKEFPPEENDHVLLAEEELEIAASKQNKPLEGKADYVWILDPIDGTRELVAGTNYYAISLALYYKGRPVLTEIYSPRYEGIFEASQDREGVYFRGVPMGNIRRTLLPKIEAAVIGDYPVAGKIRNGLKGLVESGPAVNEIKISDAPRSCVVHMLRFLEQESPMQFYGTFRTEVGQKPWDIAGIAYLVEKIGGYAETYHETGPRTRLLDDLAGDLLNGNAFKKNFKGYQVLAYMPSLRDWTEDLFSNEKMRSESRKEWSSAETFEFNARMNYWEARQTALKRVMNVLAQQESVPEEVYPVLQRYFGAQSPDRAVEELMAIYQSDDRQYFYSYLSRVADLFDKEMKAYLELSAHAVFSEMSERPDFVQFLEGFWRFIFFLQFDNPGYRALKLAFWSAIAKWSFPYPVQKEVEDRVFQIFRNRLPDDKTRNEIRTMHFPIRDYMIHLTPLYELHQLRVPLRPNFPYESKAFEQPLKTKAVNSRANKTIEHALQVYESMGRQNFSIQKKSQHFRNSVTVVGVEMPTLLFGREDQDFIPQLMQISFRRRTVYFSNRFLEIMSDPKQPFAETFLPLLFHIAESLMSRYDRYVEDANLAGMGIGMSTDVYVKIQKKVSSEGIGMAFWQEWADAGLPSPDRVQHYLALLQKIDDRYRDDEAMNTQLLENQALTSLQWINRVLRPFSVEVGVPRHRRKTIEQVLFQHLVTASKRQEDIGTHEPLVEALWDLSRDFEQIAYFYGSRGNAAKAKEFKEKSIEVLKAIQKIDDVGYKPMKAQEAILYQRMREGNLKEFEQEFNRLLEAGFVPKQNRELQKSMLWFKLPIWERSANQDLLYKLEFHRPEPDQYDAMRQFKRVRQMLIQSYDRALHEVEKAESKFDIDVRQYAQNSPLTNPLLVMVPETNEVFSFQREWNRLNDREIQVRIEAGLFLGDYKRYEKIGHLDFVLSEEGEGKWTALSERPHHLNHTKPEWSVLSVDQRIVEEYPAVSSVLLNLGLRVAAHSGAARFKLYLSEHERQALGIRFRAAYPMSPSKHKPGKKQRVFGSAGHPLMESRFVRDCPEIHKENTGILRRNEMRGEDPLNYFNRLWSRPETPLEVRIREYAAQLGALFALNADDRERIIQAASRLKIIQNDRLGFNGIIWFFQIALARLSAMNAGLFEKFRGIARDWSSDAWSQGPVRRWAWGCLSGFFFFPVLALIFPAAWIYESLQILFQQLLERPYAAWYDRGALYLFRSDLKEDAYNHELFHWLYEENIISGALPIVAAIESYLAKGRFSGRSLLPDFYGRFLTDQPVLKQSRRMEMGDETFERLTGSFYEKVSSGITRDSLKEIIRLALAAVLLETNHSAKLAKRFEEDGYPAFKKGEEHDYSTVLGFLIGQWLAEIEALLGPMAPGAAEFVPMFLFLHAHAFENQDQLSLIEPSNQKRLFLIYLASIFWSFSDPEDPKAWEMMLEQLFEDFTVLKNGEKEKVLALSKIWIHSKSKEVRALLARPEARTIGRQRADLLWVLRALKREGTFERIKASLKETQSEKQVLGHLRALCEEGILERIEWKTANLKEDFTYEFTDPHFFKNLPQDLPGFRTTVIDHFAWKDEEPLPKFLKAGKNQPKARDLPRPKTGDGNRVTAQLFKQSLMSLFPESPDGTLTGWEAARLLQEKQGLTDEERDALVQKAKAHFSQLVSDGLLAKPGPQDRRLSRGRKERVLEIAYRPAGAETVVSSEVKVTELSENASRILNIFRAHQTDSDPRLTVYEIGIYLSPGLKMGDFLERYFKQAIARALKELDGKQWIQPAGEKRVRNQNNSFRIVDSYELTSSGQKEPQQKAEPRREMRVLFTPPAVLEPKAKVNKFAPLTDRGKKHLPDRMRQILSFIQRSTQADGWFQDLRAFLLYLAWDGELNIENWRRGRWISFSIGGGKPEETVSFRVTDWMEEELYPLLSDIGRGDYDLNQALAALLVITRSYDEARQKPLLSKDTETIIESAISRERERLVVPSFRDETRGLSGEIQWFGRETGRQPKVLIVEDELQWQERLKRVFSRLGFKTVTAFHSDEAKKILTESKGDLRLFQPPNDPVDLIISDNFMQRPDEGLDFFDWLHHEQGQKLKVNLIPFVFYTGDMDTVPAQMTPERPFGAVLKEFYPSDFMIERAIPGVKKIMSEEDIPFAPLVRSALIQMTPSDSEKARHLFWQLFSDDQGNLQEEKSLYNLDFPALFQLICLIQKEDSGLTQEDIQWMAPRLLNFKPNGGDLKQAVNVIDSLFDKKGRYGVLAPYQGGSDFEMQPASIEQMAEPLQLFRPEIRGQIRSALKQTPEHLTRSGFREQSKNLVPQFSAIQIKRDDAAKRPIEMLTVPAALFLEEKELLSLTEETSLDRADEILAFLELNKGFDLYIHTADSLSASRIPLKWIHRLEKAYPGRVHFGTHDRGNLAKKQIVIQAALMPSDESAEEIQKSLARLKAQYGITQKIFPIEYHEAGALRAFLSVAESMMNGAVHEAFALLGRNGRWQVAEEFLMKAVQDLKYAYVIAWSA